MSGRPAAKDKQQIQGFGVVAPGMGRRDGIEHHAAELELGRCEI